MVKITDIELAVYQMHKNRYSNIDIADVLKLSDEAVEQILERNINHSRKLAEMDELNKRGV